MAVALASAGFLTVFVVVAAALLGVVHHTVRPRAQVVRSATALRELEPQGGRHRFHVRLFEVVAMASACLAGLGVFFVVFGGEHIPGSMVGVGGGALLVAVWWSWRRGVLRAVEAEAPEDVSRGP